MQDFGVSTDPCERSDTQMFAGNWVNSGTECLLPAQADVFGDGNPVKFELALPSEMTFAPVVTANENAYKSIRGAVILRIFDEGLHNDWGGAINEVIDQPKQVLVQMPRGCLKVVK